MSILKKRFKTFVALVVAISMLTGSIAFAVYGDYYDDYYAEEYELYEDKECEDCEEEYEEEYEQYEYEVEYTPDYSFAFIAPEPTQLPTDGNFTVGVTALNSANDNPSAIGAQLYPTARLVMAGGVATVSVTFTYMVGELTYLGAYAATTQSGTDFIFTFNPTNVAAPVLVNISATGMPFRPYIRLVFDLSELVENGGDNGKNNGNDNNQPPAPIPNGEWWINVQAMNMAGDAPSAMFPIHELAILNVVNGNITATITFDGDIVSEVWPEHEGATPPAAGDGVNVVYDSGVSTMVLPLSTIENMPTLHIFPTVFVRLNFDLDSRRPPETEFEPPAVIPDGVWLINVQSYVLAGNAPSRIQVYDTAVLNVANGNITATISFVEDFFTESMTEVWPEHPGPFRADGSLVPGEEGASIPVTDISSVTFPLSTIENMPTLHINAITPPIRLNFDLDSRRPGAIDDDNGDDEDDDEDEDDEDEDDEPTGENVHGIPDGTYHINIRTIFHATMDTASAINGNQSNPAILLVHNGQMTVSFGLAGGISRVWPEPLGTPNILTPGGVDVGGTGMFRFPLSTLNMPRLGVFIDLMGEAMIVRLDFDLDSLEEIEPLAPDTEALTRRTRDAEAAIRRANTLIAAQEHALSLLEDEFATQGQIDDALAALDRAYNALHRVRYIHTHTESPGGAWQGGGGVAGGDITDGFYTIGVRAMHQTENRLSMANDALRSPAEIIVLDGEMTLRITWLNSELHGMAYRYGNSGFRNATLERNHFANTAIFEVPIEEINRDVDMRIYFGAANSQDFRLQMNPASLTRGELDLDAWGDLDEDDVLEIIGPEIFSMEVELEIEDEYAIEFTITPVVIVYEREMYTITTVLRGTEYFAVDSIEEIRFYNEGDFEVLRKTVNPLTNALTTTFELETLTSGVIMDIYVPENGTVAFDLNFNQETRYDITPEELESFLLYNEGVSIMEVIVIEHDAEYEIIAVLDDRYRTPVESNKAIVPNGGQRIRRVQV